MNPTSIALSHIGLSCTPTLIRPFSFTPISGFTSLCSRPDRRGRERLLGRMCTDVFGAGMGALRNRPLATADAHRDRTISNLRAPRARPTP